MKPERRDRNKEEFQRWEKAVFNMYEKYSSWIKSSCEYFNVSELESREDIKYDF